MLFYTIPANSWQKKFLTKKNSWQKISWQKKFLTIGVSTLVKADILRSFSIYENSKTNVFLTSITFILIGRDDVEKKKV